MSSDVQPNNDLDALIQCFEGQKLMAEDVLDKLNELKELREEIQLFRDREILRLEEQIKGENNDNL